MVHPYHLGYIQFSLASSYHIERRENEEIKRKEVKR